MRFKDFIKNQDYQPNDLLHGINSHVTRVKDAQHMADILKENCKTMIEAYRLANEPLYRGVADSDGMDAMISKIRKNRNPVSMDKENHKLLHAAFVKLNLPATRKNSIFCTCDRSIARDWGDDKLIFIKDGWKGVVFDSVKKGYAFNELTIYSNSVKYLEKSDSEKIDQLSKLVKSLNPRVITSANDLAEVIKQQYGDIIITGHSYIGLDPGSLFTEEVLDLLDLKLKM